VEREQGVVDLIWDLSRAAKAVGFEIEEVGPHAPVPLLAFRRPAKGDPAGEPLYLSAGIHGDEPAGPLALLSLLEHDLLPRNRAIDMLPLLNPQGLRDGTRTNALGVDLNRDYRNATSHEVRCHRHWLDFHQPRYALTVCLHEDWEAKGFYAYELGPPGERTLLRPVLEAVAGVHPLDPSPEIDGLPAAEGMITPPPAEELLLVEEWPEAFLLWRDHGPRHHTYETPSKEWDLDARRAAHVTAIRAVLAVLADRGL